MWNNTERIHLVCGCLQECYPTLLIREVVGGSGCTTLSAMRNIFMLLQCWYNLWYLHCIQEWQRHIQCSLGNQFSRLYMFALFYSVRYTIWKTETYDVAVLSQYSEQAMAGRLEFDSRQGQRFVSSPPLSYRLWGLPSGYWGHFSRAQSGQNWPLTFHLAPRLRMCAGSYTPLTHTSSCHVA
jgi:hypothetical protein